MLEYWAVLNLTGILTLECVIYCASWWIINVTSGVIGTHSVMHIAISQNYHYHYYYFCVCLTSLFFWRSLSYAGSPTVSHRTFVTCCLCTIFIAQMLFLSLIQQCHSTERTRWKWLNVNKLIVSSTFCAHI